MTAILADISHPDHARRPGTLAARGIGPAAWRPSRRAVVAGRIVSGVGALFMAFDAGMKLLQAAPAIEATAQLGYPTSVVLWLGVVQLVCLALYLIPRTAVLGAVLWTGYLGGAVATHVRVESSLFGHILFPLYVAALLWGGLWLRDLRVRRLLRG